MEIIKKVIREYNVIMAVITAFVGMALGLGWFELTTEQVGLVFAFVAAIFVLLRFIVTPVNDPVLAPGTVVNASSTKYPPATVVIDE